MVDQKRKGTAMNMQSAVARRGKPARGTVGTKEPWAAGSVTADLALIVLALVGLALLRWAGAL